MYSTGVAGLAGEGGGGKGAGSPLPRWSDSSGGPVSYDAHVVIISLVEQWIIINVILVYNKTDRRMQLNCSQSL